MNKELVIQEVWRKYKRTKLIRYRNILVKYYLPLVKIVAERLRSQLPDCVDINDLVSTGIFGLITTINLFDPKRGIKFETYCVRRIRGSMLDELRELDWVPRRVRTKAHQLSRVHTELENKLGRLPTAIETAQALKLTLPEYIELIRDARPTLMLSFNYKPSLEGEDDESPEAINVIKDKEANEPMNKLLYEDIINYLKDNLSKKERLILELYFYDDLTMKEIGVVLKISESRVSQLFAGIMNRLRRRFQRYKTEWLG